MAAPPGGEGVSLSPPTTAATLTVGCTNGTVLNLHWNQLALTSDPPGSPSDPPAPPSSPPASPGGPPAPPGDPPAPPGDPPAPDPLLPLPKVIPLWPHADKIPVHHIAWQRKADVRSSDSAVSGWSRSSTHSLTLTHPHLLSGPWLRPLAGVQ